MSVRQYHGNDFVCLEKLGCGRELYIAVNAAKNNVREKAANLRAVSRLTPRTYMPNMSCTYAPNMAKVVKTMHD